MTPDICALATVIIANVTLGSGSPTGWGWGGSSCRVRENGAFTFDVSGEFAVSDPDTIDSESRLVRMVTLQVAQLVTNAK